METSNWIFESEIKESLIGIGLFGAGSFCALVYFWTKNYVDRKKDNKKIDYKPIYVAVACFVVSTYLYIYDYLPWTTFSENRIETQGVTFKKYYHKSQAYYKFKYYVGGQEFISEKNNVCYGKEIEGIVCPNGTYIVTYNKLNPSKAVIDFKRAVK